MAHQDSAFPQKRLQAAIQDAFKEVFQKDLDVITNKVMSVTVSLHAVEARLELLEQMLAVKENLGTVDRLRDPDRDTAPAEPPEDTKPGNY